MGVVPGSGTEASSLSLITGSRVFQKALDLLC